MSQPKYCVDDLGVKNGQPIGLYGCHSQNLTDTLPPQFFLLTKQNEIRLKRDPNCWDVAEPSENKNEKILVKLYGCHHQRGNQYFEYDQVRAHISKKTLIHQNKFIENTTDQSSLQVLS